MPPETEVIDAPAGEEAEFGTPLSEIFANRMPTDEEKSDKKEKKEAPKSTVETPDKTEVKPEPEKKGKAEKKPTEKVEEKGDLLSDILSSTTPKEETPTEPEVKKEAVPAGMKGEAAKNFDRIATKAQDFETKYLAAEKKIKEYESKSQTADPRVKTLEDQNKDLLGRLERAGIEYHPWFEQNITLPLNQAVQYAQKTLEDAGGDPKALMAALRMDGKARAEALDQLYSDIGSTTLRGKVERTVDAIESLEGRRNQVLSNRQEVMKKLHEQDLSNQKQWLERNESDMKNNLQEAEKFLVDKHNFFVFKKVDDPKFSWWNEQVDKMNSDAEELLLRTNDPKQIAIAAKLSSAAPVLFGLLQKEVKLRQQAEKERDAYRNSEHATGGGDRKLSSEEEEPEDSRDGLKSSIIGSIKKAQGVG